MSYLGLARKYRPQTFEEVVGQQEIAITLQNAIRSSRIHHAYLFSGSKGVGKTSMARIFAKALNCEKGPTLTPCNQCELCIRISTGEDIDVVEIDGASNRGIEEIRNIKENVKYLASRSHFKIFIIDEVHMLTQAAFNALLKTLEEPPAHVKFIFATTQINSIPDTILSRCQRFIFKTIPIADIVKRLLEVAGKENIHADEEALESIAIAAGGAMRDSLVLLEQLASYTEAKIDSKAVSMLLGNRGEEGVKLIEAIHARDAIQILSILQDFYSQGGDTSYLVESLIRQLRDILVSTVAKNADKFMEGTSQYHKWVASQTGFTPEFLILSIHHLLEAKNLVHRSLMGRVVLETVLLKILHTESMVPLRKIEESLITLEKALGKMAAQKPVLSRPEPALSRKPAPTPERPKAETGSSAGPSEKEIAVPTAVRVGLDVPEKMPRQGVPSAVPPAPKATLAPKPVETKPLLIQAIAADKAIRDNVLPVPQASEEVTLVAELAPWEKFIQGVRSKMPRQADLLKREGKAEVKDRSFVVTLPHQHSLTKQLLQTGDIRIFIQELVQKIFGKNVSLQFEFTSAPPAAAPATTRPEDKLKNHPRIKKTLELFEGRLAHVHEVVQQREESPAAPQPSVIEAHEEPDIPQHEPEEES
jgi:DNA polymerase III subunit gamma/tau